MCYFFIIINRNIFKVDAEKEEKYMRDDFYVSKTLKQKYATNASIS